MPCRPLIATLAIICASFLATDPAFGHPGHLHADKEAFDGRLPGQPDFERFGNEIRRYDPVRNLYRVERPGEPTAIVHYDPAGRGQRARQALTTNSAGSFPLPTQEDPPVCVTHGHRIVVVRSVPPLGGVISDPHDQIRETIRRMNWKLMRQGIESGGSPLQLKVECDSTGTIKVHDIETASNNYFDIRNSVEDMFEGESGLPIGREAIKIIVFRDDEGGGGSATWFPDADKSSSDNHKVSSANNNRVFTAIGVAWPSFVDSWASHTPLHELFHTMGSVLPNIKNPPWPESPPFSSSGGHCTDGFDLMCYEDGSGEYTTTRCSEMDGFVDVVKFPVDCKYDTYFDAAAESGEWLAKYWNVGGRENPYLVDPTNSDVDGDGRADLVTVDTSGTAHVFRGTAAGVESTEDTSSLGSVDPALFDGEGEYLIDVADVDGDGLSDLTTLTDAGSEGDSGVLAVHPGLSDGQFGEAIVSSEEVETGLHDEESGSIEPIAVADVTGDERGDFIAFDAVDGKVYVHPGTSEGTFEAGIGWGNGEVDSALFDGTGLYFFEVADVTGDELADLVAIRDSASSPFGTPRPIVFASNGDATFGEELVSPGIPPIIMEDGGANFENPSNAPGYAGWEPIDVSDVGGDGHADLVVHRGTSTRVYPGLENGKFSTLSVSSLSGKVNSSIIDGYRDDLVGLFDTNGDGRGDLVFSQDGSIEYEGEVMRALGKADNTFEEPQQWLDDPVTSNRFNTTPGHQMAAEKPFWRRDATNCTPIRCEWRPQPHPEQIDSDVDGDDKSDLVTVHTEGNANVYPIGAGSIGDMDSALFDDIGEYVIDVADVDGDGYDDLIVAENTLAPLFSGAVKVYPGSTSGDFGSGVVAATLTLATNGSGGEVEPIAVEDVSGDEKADLVYFDHRTKTVVGLLGRSDGTFAVEPHEPSSGTNSWLDTKDSALLDGEGSYFLDVSDVNGDNRGDLVRWDSSSGEVRYNEAGYYGDFKSTGALLAEADPIMDDGEGSEPIAVADVNGDNETEWISLAEDGSIEVNTGTTTIEALAGPIDSSLTDESGEDLIGVFDTDEDGTGDLVSIDDEGNVLRYTGNTNHTFDEPQAWFEQNITSNRFDEIPGEEIANEKPIWRRAGCGAEGCAWPPIEAPSGAVGTLTAYLGEGSPWWECGNCWTTLEGNLEFAFASQGSTGPGNVKAECTVRLDVIIDPEPEEEGQYEVEEGAIAIAVQGAELTTGEGSPAKCGEEQPVAAQNLPWEGKIAYRGDDFFEAEIDVDFGGKALTPFGGEWAGPLKMALDVEYLGEGQPSPWTTAETGRAAILDTSSFIPLPGHEIHFDYWLDGSLEIDGYDGFFEVME